MSRVSGPIRIRIVRSDYFDPAPRFCDAVQLRDESHHVWNVLDHMTTNDLVEFIIGKGIGHNAQIVNDVSLSSGIYVYADCVRIFVLAAADVKDLSGWVLCRGKV